MADVTITIQAASDAIMTVNNSYGGTALSDSDPRKCFGLPQMYISKWNSQHFSAGPRWDTVNSMIADGGRGKQGGDSSATFMTADYKSSINANYMKPPPTTTAFQLKCERITHDVIDMTRVSPMPMFSIATGSDAGVTPGQLNNIVIALGMRKEIIKLSGTLVDRGPVTAANPRRQTLLNIARTQYLKISRGGMFKDDDYAKNTGWGGAMASPLNPRSYPCLTIFDSLITPGFSIGREPSNDRRSYRGIIKTLSFTLDGGRDDIWKFDMTFEVMSNEHVHSNPVGRPEWEGRINRVEAVTSRVEKGVTINASANHSFLKVHSSRALRIKRKGVDGEDIYIDMVGEELANPDDSISSNPNIREFQTDIAPKKLGQGSIVYIEGSNSTPSINGFWHVRAVDLDNDTFILGHPGSNLFGEQAIWENAYNANRADTDTPYFISDTALEWTTAQITEVGPDEDDSAEGRIYWGAQKGLFD